MAAIIAGLLLVAGVAEAAPKAPPSDARADRIIASISARVGPNYLKYARALGQAALNLRGRARLRQMFLAETEITDYERDAEAGQWAARIRTLATAEHDARYAALARIELIRIETTHAHTAMDEMTSVFAGEPDPIVRGLLAADLAGHKTMFGQPYKVLAIIDAADTKIPRSDPDAFLVLNALARARAYSLSQMGDVNGVLNALSDAEFRYRPPEGPVWAVSELTLLILEAIDLEDGP
jgi:hypothetical protein